MQLIDQRATDTSPSSLFLMREEFRELYPHLLSSRINYVFRHKQPKEVNDNEAKLLLKKYPHLLKWEEQLQIEETNRHQELDKLSYQELKKFASGLKMTWNEMQGKKPVLIDKIVKKEIENADI